MNAWEIYPKVRIFKVMMHLYFIVIILNDMFYKLFKVNLVYGT